MTNDGGRVGAAIPREQVETALRFLEWSHGDALRRPWSDEAHAYYQAIDILEGALDEELRPPEGLPWMESEEELIQQSRAAREDGYRAATLLDERFGTNEDNRALGLAERIKRWFSV